MNLHFMQTGQMTDAQAAAIDKVLAAHKITVPDGGEVGGFDWLCERIESALAEYVWAVKERPPESKADALAKIKRLEKALMEIHASGSCYGVLSEAALHTTTERVAYEAGLERAQSEGMKRIGEKGSGAFGECSDAVCEWVSEHAVNTLFDLALPLLTEACELALSDALPEALGTDKDIVEWKTRGSGRPPDDAKQQLVRDLARDFETAAGRRATDTESGPFDDFVSACMAVIEPPRAAGTSNRKLIRKALQYVPKPRRRN